MKITISCAMGLESVLKFELFDLGLKDLHIDNGYPCAILKRIFGSM